MTKLAWVVLPLLLAAAAVAWLAWRGRAPSRRALNVWFSVLLLAYVGTTAGLGIFWVANQQLPVFDWHYLFGYATVALLVLHLSFNFRVVWRHWFGRNAASPAARASAAERRLRLPLLGGLGLIAATGGAFLLGLRHGRTELHVAPAAVGEAENALAVVERFHEFSAQSRRGVFRRAPGVDWGDPPPPFKAYPGAAVLGLPPPARSAVTAGRLDRDSLATLLWHTAAVNLRSGGLHFRTAPSSGALFATELYIAVRDLPGLPAGLWHYDGSAHALHRLGDRLPTPDDLGSDRQAAAYVIATALFRRSGHKYRDRTYRYVLADLGHALENLRATSAALALPWAFVAAFDESRAAATLGLDQAEEGVLALLALGAPPEPHAAASAAAPPVPRWHAPRPEAHGVLGVTEAIHRATSLQRGDAAPALAPSPGPTRPGPGPSTALPEPSAGRLGTLERIARRRSVRRYRDAPLRLAALSALLDAMGRHAAPQLSAAVRIHVVTHAVESLAPAAWRYDSQAHALRPSGSPRREGADLRGTTRRAALDQDVAGDAAAVFVLSIDRATLAADPGGAARGYRHAFIEAGLLGERLYLEGVAQGLGVCGIGAFYDDEASELVGVDPAREWIVHFAAVGWPAG